MGYLYKLKKTLSLYVCVCAHARGHSLDGVILHWDEQRLVALGNWAPSSTKATNAKMSVAIVGHYKLC